MKLSKKNEHNEQINQLNLRHFAQYCKDPLILKYAGMVTPWKLSSSHVMKLSRNAILDSGSKKINIVNIVMKNPFGLFRLIFTFSNIHKS